MKSRDSNSDGTCSTRVLFGKWLGQRGLVGIAQNRYPIFAHNVAQQCQNAFSRLWIEACYEFVGEQKLAFCTIVRAIGTRSCFAPKSQNDYIHAVANLTRFLADPPTRRRPKNCGVSSCT